MCVFPCVNCSAKDPVKTLSFYCDLLNMRCLARKDFSDFSLFFLASLPEGTGACDLFVMFQYDNM